MKKASINGKFYNVVEEQEFNDHLDIYTINDCYRK